ncbi:MAG: hypothetical protein RR617_03480, partial [Anaerovoracaceae bacterium]
FQVNKLDWVFGAVGIFEFQGKRPTIFGQVDGIYGFLLKRPSILRFFVGHWLEKCCWAVNPTKTPNGLIKAPTLKPSGLIKLAKNAQWATQTGSAHPNAQRAYQSARPNAQRAAL